MALSSTPSRTQHTTEVIVTLIISGLFVLIAMKIMWAGESQEVIRTTTRVVTVDVIAEDKDGKPVSDLTQEEFTIEDEHRPQQIASFSAENVQRTTARDGQDRPVFGNRSSHVPIVILVDFSNSSYTAQLDIKTQVQHWLKQRRNDDRIALLGLREGLDVLGDFTGDHGVLAGALNTYEPRNGFRDHPEPLLLFDQIIKTASALEKIGTRLSRFEGRKALIWISNYFPIATPTSLKEYGREYERVIHGLIGDGVAIYAVDPSGLHPPPMGLPPGQAPEADRSSMQTLAGDTGGRSFYDWNDFGVALTNAIDESGARYSLSFHPDHEHWDGSFHQIKVSVARRGVTLLYRKGYVANEFPPPAKVPEN